MVSPDDYVFPFGDTNYRVAQGGIDLRTWMATQIAAGYRASKPASVSPVIAELAVRDADELIKELNK